MFSTAKLGKRKEWPSGDITKNLMEKVEELERRILDLESSLEEIVDHLDYIDCPQSQSDESEEELDLS